MTTTIDTGEATTATDDGPPRPGSRRVLILTVAALVMLLVGAAIGMLITTARTDAYGPPGSDSVDVGFAQDMQVHHLQAVTMAGIVRDKTTDPKVRTLAFDIESLQQTQIGMMSGWLNLWERPLFPERGTHLAWLPTAGHGHDAATNGMATMPGMATTAELNRLRTLSGRELDSYFLQLMLRHHQGGLVMARYAAQHAGQSVIRNLADKIVLGQTNDNILMTQMLAERGTQPLPAPN